MPVNQMGGIYSEYPQLVAELSFTTVKDYDDWIARLHAIPKAFDQVTTNMSIGIDDHRVPPKFLLEKALEQVKAARQSETGRLAPGHAAQEVFPASIPAAEQERIKAEMLGAIGKEVLPAYQRFARFLEVSLHSCGPRTARHLCVARRREVLPVPHSPDDDHGADRGPDSSDRPRRSEEGRSRDAGDRAEARLPGPEELSRKPERQSKAASSFGRCSCWTPTAAT